MKETQKFTLYDMVMTGLMGAVVFIVTMFLSVKIPTPAGQTMIKLANAFILLAGILLGGVRGGLAAGIGSMLYDLTDPIFAPDCFMTFIRFFLMGFICGKIAWSSGAQGHSIKRNFVASVVACTFSTIFYIGKGIITMMYGGSAFWPALVGQSANIVSSLINLVIAVVIAGALAPMMHRAFKTARV